MNETDGIDIIKYLEEHSSGFGKELPVSARTLSETDMRLLADEIGRALVKILVDAGILARG